MMLIPAIDLLDGRVVRLAQGDYARQTRFDTDPLQLARMFAKAGAEWLHVVDLDAAKDGGDANLPVIERLCKSGLNIQTGGGVRNQSDLQRRLDTGAARVVIGSLCVRAPELICDWLQSFGASRLVAGLDVKSMPDGRWLPQAAGWREAGTQDLWTLLKTLTRGGLTHLLCTDIERDGMLTGPNTSLYSEITTRYPALELQASGGVGETGHLRAAAEAGAAACIVGRALLEGNVAMTQIARWSSQWSR